MAGTEMTKKKIVEVKPPLVTRQGKPQRLPLPSQEEAYAVYLAAKGSVYAVRQHYLQAAAENGYRVPAEKTLYTWEEKNLWKEKYKQHLLDTEKAVEKQGLANATRRALDARSEVEDVCGLIFDRLKSVIPDLPIKTAADVRQLGLVTKDYLEIRDRIEGTGADKKAEEIAKTAESRVQEATEQSDLLFEQLKKAHTAPEQRPN